MARLRQNAARENRTLNNYVESVLLDVVYHEPNATTRAAIKDSISVIFFNNLYTYIEEMMNGILNEEEE